MADILSKRQMISSTMLVQGRLIEEDKADFLHRPNYLGHASRASRI